MEIVSLTYFLLPVYSEEEKRRGITDRKGVRLRRYLSLIFVDSKQLEEEDSETSSGDHHDPSHAIYFW